MSSKPTQDLRKDREGRKARNGDGKPLQEATTLGVDSFSILFNRCSFQVRFPEILMVS